MEKRGDTKPIHGPPLDVEIGLKRKSKCLNKDVAGEVTQEKKKKVTNENEGVGVAKVAGQPRRDQ